MALRQAEVLALDEEGYWAWYSGLIAKFEREDRRCACHDELLNLCESWQAVRLAVFPAPSEDDLISSKRSR